MSVATSPVNNHTKHRSRVHTQECAVCGSKAIGVNFGAPTCAPCKAFFRRNARRREPGTLSCHIDNMNISESENVNDDNKNLNSCAQIRHCTACRLRRCFDVGMKVELVRTDEERQHYRQLVERNRQRRRNLLQSQQKLSQSIMSDNDPLQESDWKLLSNIVYAYDNYCLKLYRDKRQKIFDDEMKFTKESISKVKHHEAMRANNMTSFIVFLSSIPTIQLLSAADRFYLSKHNILSLILPNLHEMEQTCFTEQWQVEIDNAAAEYVYGKALFDKTVQVKQKAESILITDPAVTRLWLLILFFSTSLVYDYDHFIPQISDESRFYIHEIQNSLVILLWNYLTYRHGHLGAIRIFTNHMRIYLQMQRIARAVSDEVRSRNDLNSMTQTFNQILLSQGSIEQ